MRCRQLHRMFSARRRPRPIVLLALAMAAAGCLGPARPEAEQTLGTVAAMREHHASSPKLGAPARIDAHLTYVDNVWRLYLASDGTGYIEIDPGTLPAEMQPG